jgi:dihydropyrimidine dehydrogenase (NAD+) subunit PreA
MERGGVTSMNAIELSIEFAGIRFANPFVLAASPSTHSGEQVRRALDYGWSGVVWKTLGTITGVEHPKVSPCYAYSGTYKRLNGFENIDLGNDMPLYRSFQEIQRVKKDYPSSVVIVSIRGETSEEKWKELAFRAEDAGADILELMFSCPHDIADNPDSEGDIGRQAETITRWTKETVHIPVMVKMSPNVTDVRVPARAAKAGGADAISATNTIRSLLGVDLETLRPVPTVGGMSTLGGYSGPAIKPIILRIVAELAGDAKLSLPISAIGGVVSWRDALEYLLLGAGMVQVGTAAMLYGFKIVEGLLSGLENFLTAKGFSSVSEIRGLSLPYLTTHARLDRGASLKAKLNPDKCTHCLRCHVACRDGAYQAIEIVSERSPVILEEKCRGCSLCTIVCPSEGAIEMVP